MDDTQCAECNNDFTKVLNNDGKDGKDGKDSPRRCGSSNTNAVYVEEKGEMECNMLVQDQYMYHGHL